MNQLTNFEKIYPLFFQAMDQAGLGAWYWDLNSNQYEWSRYTKQILSLPEGHSPSIEHFYSVVHPEDKEEVERLLNHAILHKSDNYQAEYRLIGQDGSIRWVSAPGWVFFDEDAKPFAMAGMIMDITPRKASEAMSQKIDAQFRQIYESALVGIALADQEGHIERANPAFQALVGYSEAELQAMHLKSLIHPDDLEANAVDFRHLVSGKTNSLILENRYQNKQGQDVWVRKILSILPEDSDGTVKILAMVRDLTESKTLEAKLAESQYLRELALTGAELGTWDCNLVNGVTHYDERYCAMLGYRPDEIEQTINGWKNMIHPDDVPSVNEAVQKHLNGDTRFYESEHRLRHKTGHWVWILARGKVTYDPEGQAVRVAGTMFNITDRKHAAEEGLKLLRKIEELISGIGQVAEVQKIKPAENVSSSHRLSPRALEVLCLVAEGCSAAQIAQRLSISKATAETHRRDLMRKLGLKNKAELVRYAIQHNLTR